MILKVNIHRYKDKDASVSFDLFKVFLLTINSFSLDIFFNRQLQNVCDHILWNFASLKSVLSVEMDQMHKNIF